MPKKGCLGCSFPVLIGIIILFLALFIISFVYGPLGQKLLGNFGVNIQPPAFLAVSTPEPELPAQAVFHVFGFPITNSILATWFTMIVLVVFAYAATRKIKLIPSKVQNLFEFAVESLLKFCQGVAGEKNGRIFFPIIATIFLFVIFNAWLSLLPGFGSILVHTSEGEVHLLRGANTDVNTPLALAIVSFVVVEFFGLKALRGSYLKKFFNFGRLFGGLGEIFRGKLKSGLGALFFGAIDVFVGVLEALSEVIRIVSFTFRLFGNMTAGEILLLIAAFLIPWIFAIPFYMLELLVGFVQALIFGGLTLVFLTIAVAGHGEEETETH